jgi:chaperone required for assembly of F1-ATPase
MTSLPRRFYRQVAVTAAADGWQITLDGKVLRSPAKAPLILPTAQLAEAIRAEWDSQVDHIRPHSMPMMQLASTAIDRVRENFTTVATDIAGYAGSDLVCYLAEVPAELVRRQTELWQPLLDWANHRYDTALQTTTSMVAIAQSAASLARYQQVVAALDAWQLTGLAHLTGTTGSLIIALALLEHHISPAEAVAAAQLDELFQAERWGEDAEALQRRQGLASEITDAAAFLALVAQQ